MAQDKAIREHGIPYKGPPPKGKPLKAKHPLTKKTIYICGAESKRFVLPSGEPCCCEQTHVGPTGRCAKHGGGKGRRAGGRIPTPDSLAKKAAKVAADLTQEEIIRRWLGAAADVAITNDLLSGLSDIETFERRKIALAMRLSAGEPQVDCKEASRLCETFMDSGGSPEGLEALKKLRELLKSGAARERIEDRYTSLTLNQNKLRETEHRRLTAAEEMIPRRMANSMLLGSHMQGLKTIDELLAPILARLGVGPEEYRSFRETYCATIGGFLLGERGPVPLERSAPSAVPATAR